MHSKILRLAGASALLALSLTTAGCKKSDTAGAERNSANPENSTDSTKAAVADKTAVAQDTASAVTGTLTAATAGALTSQGFVDDAVQNDTYAIQAAELAVQRSTSASIKRFAAGAIAVHTKSLDGLKRLVASGKVGDVTVPTALDGRRQGLIDNLKSASSDDFDPRYVDQQQAAHRELETLMKGYASVGSNAELKSYAAAQSPIVAEHTKMAERLDRGNADHDNKPDQGTHGGTTAPAR